MDSVKKHPDKGGGQGRKNITKSSKYEVDNLSITYYKEDLAKFR